MEWWLLAGALLIAPLPASLMFPNPHLTRALIAAPGYALLAGIGLALVVRDQRRKTNDEGASVVHASSFALSLGRNVRRVVVALVLVALLWQGGQRFGGYLQQFPAVISAKYQDGMFETMQAAVRIAPQYDEVWIDDRMPFPYIFVLAAQPMPPAQAQAQIQVMHGHTTFNTVTAIGPYRFVNLAALPNDLPVVEALPSNIGGPGFVIQEWHTDQGRVLVVRRMRAA